ncbi:serine hydrolase domain-containing protein [Dyella sp. OK004]|uniref:serine hydrolase domain-containing protein n=1 Tax=Dyella sp. OK004 TaxID=1855292 RepID=UPI0015A6C326|nr:serine hydrolase domain-containing protein [Dyella sp. OK004]
MAEKHPSVEGGLMLRTNIQGEPTQTFDVYERMKRYRVPAVSVAVIQNGKVSWTATYELPSPTSGKMSERTMFQAASISKSVTGLLAARLAQAGKVDLDANVDAYLAPLQLPPGKQTPANPVTLRKLLSHTAGATVSGFPGYKPGSAIPTTDQVVLGQAPAITPAVTIDTAPGSKYTYSGGGYTLLQLALERHVDMTFEQLMKQWVLDPLSMNHSTFAQPLPASAPAHASGHFFDGTEVEGGAYVYPEEAAAGLWTTPEDLANLLIAIRHAALEGGPFLSSASAQEMLTPKLNNYAFGVFVVGEGERRRFMHSGGNAGFKSTYVMFLGSGNGVVVMTNGDNGSYLGGEFVKAVAMAYHWPDFRPRDAVPAAVDHDVAAAHLGSYRYEKFEGRFPNRVVLAKQGSDWSLVLPDLGPVRIVPTGPLSFVAPETGETIEMSSGQELPFLMIGGRKATLVAR